MSLGKSLKSVKLQSGDDTSSSQPMEHERRNSPYTTTEADLQRRLDHVNRGRYISQLYCAIAASMAALSFGTILGWSSPGTATLITGSSNHVNLSADNYGWVTSLMPLGCSVGIMPWYYAVTQIGPKHTLIFQTPFYIVTFFIMSTISKFSVFLGGRFLFGFLSIANMIGGECLLVDCVHHLNLRQMMTLFRSSVWLGVLLTYIIGHFWSLSHVTIACSLIPVLNAVFLVFLPESPVFLYNKSEGRAENALAWYRGHTNNYTEMRQIKRDAELRRMGSEGYRYMFFAKVVVKAMLIIAGLIFFDVFSGYYAFVFYTLVLWNEEEDIFNPFVDAVCFGSCLYVSNFVFNWFMYRIPFGVRKPIILSTFITAVALTVITFNLYFIDAHVYNGLFWMPLFMLCLYVVGYEMGLGSYTNTLILAYLPYQIQVSAKCLLHIWFWFLVFVMTQLFIVVRDDFHSYVVFGILAGITYVGVLYCYLVIIEPKGKSLLELQIEIGGNPIGNRGQYRSTVGSLQSEIF